MRVVFDTSVLVAAVRSRDGASFALVSSIPSDRFEICSSVALYLEWQDVLTRPEHVTQGRTVDDALKFVRFLGDKAWLQPIYFLWRPYLPDPGDDMILELAMAAGCQYIVTHNVRHFAGAEKLGINPLTPGAFIRLLKEEVKS